MQSKKNLVIWMDFSIAYLMECTNDEVLTVIIKSGNNQIAEKSKSSLNDNLLKLPDEKKLSSYYRKISDCIIVYEEVTLLGPPGSKNELFSILLLDPLFNSINMSVKDAVKMNESERESFIRSNAVRTDRAPSAFRKRESSFVEYEPFGYFTTEV